MRDLHLYLLMRRPSRMRMQVRLALNLVNQLSLGCLDLGNQVLQVISLGRYDEIMRLLTGRFQIYASCTLHVLVLSWPDTNAEATLPKGQALKALALQIIDRAELEV